MIFGIKNYSLNFFRRSRGQIALPTILLMSGIIIEIALTVVFTAFILINAGWRERLSGYAISAARSGVEDAFVKIARDKTFSSPTAYNLSADSWTAEVTVIREPIGYPSNRDQIISVGKALIVRRKLEAILVVDSESSQISLESIREVE